MTIYYFKRIIITLLITISAFFLAHTASAATIVVDITNDSDNVLGECSLRDAINSINNGALADGCANSSADPFGTDDQIHFSAFSNGTHTITLSSQLPTILRSMTIDGLTQSGAFCGTENDFSDRDLSIVIDGTNAGSFQIGSSFVTLRGIVFDAFNGITVNNQSNIDLECVTIDNASSNAFNGNEINATTFTSVVITNGQELGIFIDESSNITIQDSYIVNNGAGGIALDNSNNIVIINNTVSETFVNPSEFGVGIFTRGENILIENNTISNIENAPAIQVDGSGINISNNDISNIVNGNAFLIAESENITISNNGISNITGASAILLAESENVTISNNTISNVTDSDFFAVFLVAESTDITIHTNTVTDSQNDAAVFLVVTNNVTVENNTFIDNTFDRASILIYGFDNGLGLIPESLQSGNTITSNTIHNNGDIPVIDIIVDPTGDFFNTFDLGTLILFGLNPNDEGDLDVGPNNLQNHPIIRSFTTSGGNITITFDADFQAGDYIIQAYTYDNALSPNHPEAKYYKGQDTITHTGSGEESFTLTFPYTQGDIVTLSATNEDGSTSEFSQGSPLSVEQQTTRRSSARLSSAQLAQMGITTTQSESPHTPSETPSQDRDTQILELLTSLERDENGNITQQGFIQFIMQLIQILR